MKKITFNKENNHGRVTVDMDDVVSYELDPQAKNDATKITFRNGESIIVADTVGQIEVLLKWYDEGKLDKNGNA